MEDSRIFDRSFIIQPPELPEIRPGTTPEDIMTDFDRMMDPNQRLASLFKSLFFINEEQSLEAHKIRQITTAGMLGGIVAKVVMSSKDISESYKLKHNATLHSVKFASHRHFYDSILAEAITKSINFGLKCAVTTGIGVSIPFASVTYRNKLHWPDFLIGMGAVGSLSRTWLGPKAMLFGAGVGTCVGAVFYGWLRLYEMASGKSVIEMRYLEHVRWKKKREEMHKFMANLHSKEVETTLRKDYDAIIPK